MPAVRAGGAARGARGTTAGRRDGGEPGADAADRRAVFADAVLRQPEAGGGAGRQSQARAAADAA